MTIIREDPLLRHVRIEAANVLANAIIDVINDHMRHHGVNDPALKNILLAVIATVVSAINLDVASDFGALLADMDIKEDE